MAGVENINSSARHILAVAFRFAEVEGQVMLAPDHQQGRLRLAHPRLPFRVSVDIGPIVVKQVALNVRLAGLAEKGKLIGPEIRVVAFEVRIVSNMARPCRSQREKVGSERTFVRSAIGPKGSTGLPTCGQAFVVRDRILNDESLD